MGIFDKLSDSLDDVKDVINQHVHGDDDTTETVDATPATMNEAVDRSLGDNSVDAQPLDDDTVDDLDGVVPVDALDTEVLPQSGLDLDGSGDPAIYDDAPFDDEDDDVAPNDTIVDPEVLGEGLEVPTSRDDVEPRDQF